MELLETELAIAIGSGRNFEDCRGLEVSLEKMGRRSTVDTDVDTRREQDLRFQLSFGLAIEDSATMGLP